MSSAKRQNNRRIRKCAARSGSLPRLRNESASAAKSEAASSVTSAAVRFGPESVWIGKQSTENIERRKTAITRRYVLQQILECESIDLLRGVRKVGVNLKARKVTNYEQGRIFQILAILQELLICNFEIFVLALVFPSKMAALPHVSETLAASRGRHTLLKSVGLVGVIISRRMRISKGVTKLDKVHLRARAFREFGATPLANKVQQSRGWHVFQIRADVEVLPEKTGWTCPIFLLDFLTPERRIRSGTMSWSQAFCQYLTPIAVRRSPRRLGRLQERDS